eukprot:jgi/Hompol1/412/HPOL_003644-RA
MLSATVTTTAATSSTLVAPQPRVAGASRQPGAAASVSAQTQGQQAPQAAAAPAPVPVPVPSVRERPPSPPPHLFDSATKAHYAVGPLLGQGGFARCYEVTDSEANRFAVKVVHKPSLKSSKQTQKLLSEIKIHKSFAHPSIVKFHHVFEDDENVYMILELCENKTFVDMLKKRKRLTEPEVRYYMFQLLDSVRYMHRHGVIHRDIKLGNLFLARRMQLKIGDFGLATVIKHDGERKMTICGTPNYIAPEVLSKEGHSFEVDTWSVGIVMYTLVVGKPPFQTKDVKEIYERISRNEYEFPKDIPVSDQARVIISSLLSTNPGERPSIDAVLEHPFFSMELIPIQIPVSALTYPPTFKADDFRQSPAGGQAAADRALLQRAINTQSPDRASEGEPLAQVAPVTSSAVAPLPKPTLAAVSAAEKLAYIDGKNNQQQQQQQQQASTSKSIASLQTTQPELKPADIVTRSAAAMRSLQQIITTRAAPSTQSQQSGSSDTKPVSPSVQTGFAAYPWSPEPLREGNGKRDSLGQRPSSASPLSPAPAALGGVNLPWSPEKPTSPAAAAGKKSAIVSSPPPQIQIPAIPSSPPPSQPAAVDSPRRGTASLEEIFRALSNGLDEWQARTSSNSNDRPIDELSDRLSGMVTSDPPPTHPDTFITKWIDYSNKYGLGYQLRDGSVGVYFNDSTSIILAANNHNFEYLYSTRIGDRTTIQRDPYTLTDFPSQLLNKKVTLLKHFRGYMHENLNKKTGSQIPEVQARKSNMEYLTKYLRTKMGVFFRLSNQTIQLNLFDHTKLIIWGRGRLITYIDTSREMRTQTLEWFTKHGPADVIERLIYARTIIAQILARRSNRAGATNGTG